MAKRFVIELTDVANPQFKSYHYGYNLRHCNQGESNERVTYWVINGGWRAGVYKDGRRTVNGKFFRPWPGKPVSLVAVTKFIEIDNPGNASYDEVIYSALHGVRS